MGKYRKKPVVIDAERFDGTNEILGFIATTGPAPLHGNDARYQPSKRALFIKTREGEMRADEGDWIVCGVQGEFYPVKPDIFDATYDPADPASLEDQPR